VRHLPAPFGDRLSVRCSVQHVKLNELWNLLSVSFPMIRWRLSRPASGSSRSFGPIMLTCVSNAARLHAKLFSMPSTPMRSSKRTRRTSTSQVIWSLPHTTRRDFISYSLPTLKGPTCASSLPIAPVPTSGKAMERRGGRRDAMYDLWGNPTSHHQ
jgi:hypothetical protein